MKRGYCNLILSFFREKLFFIVMLVLTLFMSLIAYRVLNSVLHPLDGELKDISVGASGESGNWSIFSNEQGQITPLTLADDGFSYQGLSYLGQTFYASRVLSETFPDAVLQLGLANNQVSIFLDSKLLYTDAPDGDNRIGYVTLSQYPVQRNTGLSITLPPDYSGKTLTIAQSQRGSEKQTAENIVYPCTVSIGSTMALKSVDIAASALTAYPAVLLGVLGIILMVLFLFQAYQKHAEWQLLFLALFSLTWMTDIILLSPYCCYFFDANISAYEQLIRYISISFLLLFLLFRMQRCHKIFLPLVLLQLISLPLYYLVYYSTVTLPEKLYMFCASLPDYSSMLCILAGFVLMVPELRKGNWFFLMLKNFLIITVVCGLVVAGIFLATHNFQLRLLLGAPGTRGITYYLLLLRYFLIISCFIISCAEFIRHMAQKNTSLEMLRLKNHLAQESYAQLNQYTDQVIMLRHDEKKHLTVLSSLIEYQDYEKATEYMNELIQQCETVVPVINTDNYMINTILNSKLGAAERMGIRVDIRHATAPEKLNIADTDLCSLLMNILDNAISAAQLVPEENRYITIDLHIKNNFFCFSCENSALNPQLPLPSEDSSSLKLHGYGLLILEKTVEKYHGVHNISHTDHSFTVSIALKR